MTVITRDEFSKATKRLAFERARGCCENAACGAVLQVGRIHYDHIIACALGGDSSIDNCAVLCTPCHRAKTSAHDTPRITKTRHIRDSQRGIRKSRQRFRGWRRFNGEAVYARRT